jgi:uncharacterized membrane protein
MNKSVFIFIPILFVLDIAFLSFQRNTFEKQIFAIQKEKIQMNIPGAIACYFFLLFGLYYFILKDRRSPLDAMLLGLVIYAVYETTTYAVLKNWKLKTVMIDTLWGGILFYFTTYFTYMFVDYLRKNG